MTHNRPRRLKTLTGASSVISAGNDTSPVTGIKRAIELARKAEAEKITGLFTADLLHIDPAGLAGTAGIQEPIIALAALSQVTSHIGLIATVSTTFHYPYNLARQIGTLDHASGGRAGWNAVTSSVGEENFGETLPSPEERYERAAEFIEIVNALYDANERNAAERKASGAIGINPAKFHPINYRGKHFQVDGPLNVPPLPQGRPVQFQAGQSEAGVTVGARYAEVVYTSQPKLEDAIAFATELRRRATSFGRAAGFPLIMNSFHSVIGDSDADVARRLKEKHERIDYEQGRLKLADMLGGDLDLSELPLDKPLPEALLPEVTSINRRRGRVEIFRRYAREGLTLRQLIIQAQETGHWSVAGTPEQLADAIEERFRAGILDVLSLHGFGNPDQEDLLVNGLLPELRRRSIIDTDYIGDDFRSNLELPPYVVTDGALNSARRA
ncbi:FMN-dependent oxidoreductase (nitrilotriacetate monooxygenase family) [Rhizobium sp. ERR 922]|uniref:NtaA/DmoA family FMN-dependent monooxygenase n=1 Tax=unclassified Rhizobium TaxID=2613769 RepID=UPI0011A7D178|nr:MULTISPECIES: NtaA/DmoA family FMN-dependent monooxygenase [unclassified Rhizobium]TWB46776.1 FMN-dependent oxidoreductase (nitrilotriacetate monooxygenase family) [Rhizobium sp. ERR 922]TWB89109.1 FMN-dependent oxidoreductase (nitrilotriacetate monooxygenase family) [Rhizobium sp. ERR 942]